MRRESLMKMNLGRKKVVINLINSTSRETVKVKFNFVTRKLYAYCLKKKD